jgi:tRNA threonylcarbamoyladenosine biosynthesis protein TsaB
MIVLGLETATAVCAAAIVGDDRVLAERMTEGDRVHSGRLMPMIDAVLEQSGVGRHDLDAIAVSIGPGSFTGLRIGLSTAKGLAYALDRPIMAVSTLEALAVRAQLENLAEPGDCVLSVINAGRGEVYAALYESVLENGTPAIRKLQPPRAAIVADVLEMIPDSRIIHLMGDGAEYIQQFAQVDGRSGRFRIPSSDHRRCSAVAVAMSGRRNQPGDRATLEPMYLKDAHISQPRPRMVTT